MTKYADVWNDLHKEFAKTNEVKYDDWLEEFDEIVSKVDTKIIDLGCGVTGNNTLYLLEKGKKVISCDFAEEALKVVSKIKGSETSLFDMRDGLPFEDNYTNLIIADLSLHYFKKDETEKIISEIKRVLLPNGYLFVRLNSTNSSEYKKLIANDTKEIEHNLFFASNMEKRFFDDKDVKEYFKEWKVVCKKEENMARWCKDKIIWKCAFQNIKK